MSQSEKDEAFDLLFANFVVEVIEAGYSNADLIDMLCMAISQTAYKAGVDKKEFMEITSAMYDFQMDEDPLFLFGGTDGGYKN